MYLNGLIIFPHLRKLFHLSLSTLINHFSFQSSIDVTTSVVLLLSTLTIKDPYQVRNTGILASLECRLWNTEFLLWSLFITSTYHMIMMTVERYYYSYYYIEVRIIFGVEFFYSYILCNTNKLYDVAQRTARNKMR